MGEGGGEEGGGRGEEGRGEGAEEEEYTLFIVGKS